MKIKRFDRFFVVLMALVFVSFSVINIQPLLTLQNIHSNQITDLLFIQNQNILITASGDFTIKSWDISNTNNITMLKTFVGHTQWVRALQQIDNERIVSGGSDNKIIIWNITTGYQIAIIVTPAAVVSLEYDKNFDYVFAGSAFCGSCPSSQSFGIRVYNITTKTLVNILVNHTNVINSLTYVDQHLIASGSGDGKINLYNFTAGRLLNQFQGLGYFPVFSVMKIPMQTIILAGNAYGQILVFNYSNIQNPLMNTLQFHAINQKVNVIIHISDNMYASGADDRQIYIVDFKTSQIINNITGQKNEVQTLLYLQQNGKLISGDFSNLSFWQMQFCPSGYFQTFSQISQTCQICSYQCLTCIVSNSNCTICASIRINAPQCICPVSYFDNGVSAQCQNCLSKCSSCDSAGCLQCQNGRQGPPACLCPDGQYEGPNNACFSCSSQCSQCFGMTSSECIGCKAPYFLQSNQCLISCAAGFYQDVIKNQCVQQCPQNSFVNQTSLQCEQCSQNCQSCYGKNQNQCYSCISGFYLFSNECVPVCDQSLYFTDQSSRICRKCSDYFQNCASCSKAKCQSCQDGSYLDEFFKCTACHLKCRSCIGPEEYYCTSCSSLMKRYFIQENNTCMCLPGYFERGQAYCESSSGSSFPLSNSNNSKVNNCTNQNGSVGREYANIYQGQVVIQDSELNLDQVCIGKSNMIIIYIMWPFSVLLVMGIVFFMYMRKKIKLKKSLVEKQEEIVYLRNEQKSTIATNHKAPLGKPPRPIKKQTQESIDNRMQIQTDSQQQQKKQKYSQSSLQNIDSENQQQPKNLNVVLNQGEESIQTDDRYNSERSVQMQRQGSQKSLNEQNQSIQYQQIQDTSQIQLRENEDVPPISDQKQKKEKKSKTNKSRIKNKTSDEDEGNNNKDKNQPLRQSMVQKRTSSSKQSSPEKQIQIEEEEKKDSLIKNKNQEILIVNQDQMQSTSMKFKKIEQEEFSNNEIKNSQQNESIEDQEQQLNQQNHPRLFQDNNQNIFKREKQKPMPMQKKFKDEKNDFFDD